MLSCVVGVVCRYYHANNGRRPGCLLVYRDGVSDSELERVRCDEVASIIQVCQCQQFC